MNRRRIIYDEPDYLKFTALESGTFTLTIPSSITTSNVEYIEYSTDKGKTWSKTQNVDNEVVTITTPTINTNEEVIWRGHGTKLGGSATTESSIFSSTGTFNVSGNLSSLIYRDNTNKTITGSTSYVFCYLFCQCSSMIDASELILPQFSTGNTYIYWCLFEKCTSLTKGADLPKNSSSSHCCHYMYGDCSALTEPPLLPSIFVKTYAYSTMFGNCVSLSIPPELPATTLETYCYNNMFYRCTSLTTAPILSANTIASGCYREMFSNCTSLTTTPTLPASTLASDCYRKMFQGCTSLTTAPILSANTIASGCYREMFLNCTSLTTTPALSASTIASDCYRSMFQGCTSLTTAPSILLATTLAGSCYQFMFQGCTSLTSAPALPATTLANNCYYSMFRGCTNLTSPPLISATTLASDACVSMFYDCKQLTSSPELNATELVSNCYGSMFRGSNRINYIKALFTTTPSGSYTSNWVLNVASSGIFVKNVNATWTDTGDYAVPTNWTIIYYDPDEGKYYLDQNKTTECDDHGHPRVAYLESSGTQYITLDCAVSKDSTFEVGGEIIPIYTSDLRYGVFGANPNAQFSASEYSLNSSNFLTYASTVGGQATSGGWGGTSGESTSFSISTSQITYGETTRDLSRPLTANITQFRLFGSFANNNRYPIRICSFYIKADDEYIYDLIPVNVNGTGYMYDKISKQLFGNDGTGNFIIGT